jgi:Bacterial Ig domain/FG-GAP-like repeat/FG-GAP repeat
MIVTNKSQSVVSVSLNTTTPGADVASFASQQTFATGTIPYPVTIEDMNGDGLPDVIVANSSDNTVSVLLNTTIPGATTPTFMPQQTFATGVEPESVAVADANGDGLPDVIVANYTDSTVSVLLNTTSPGATTPTFALQQTFATLSNPQWVAMADVNGDGKPDMIVTNKSQSVVSVSLNTTTPGADVASFASQQTFSTGRHPYSVTMADMNGDGEPDLIVANQSDNTVSILLNTTAPGASTSSFAPQQTFATGTIPFWVTTADVNGDGEPDLIVTNGGDGTVSVLLNTTTPGATTLSFATQQAFAVGTDPWPVTVADVNGDGIPDLIVGNRSDATISVLLNTTAPDATTPSFAPQQIFATGNEPESVAVADMNGDGKPDVVVANIGDNTVSVLLNTHNTISVAPASVTGTIHYDTEPVVNLSPNSLDFGSVQLGSSSAPQIVTLTNLGGMALTGIALAFAGSNASDYAETNNCPSVLISGSACSINVTFVPSAVGARVASLAISSNATSSPDTVSLSATGTDVAPTATNGSITTTSDVAVSNTLQGSTAYTGQTLTYSVTQPSHGTVSVNSTNGNFTYTPTQGFAGSDSFTFQVTDQWGTAATATEGVTVNDVAPTVSGTTSFTMTHNTSHNGSVTSSPQYTGQVLTFSVVTNPGHGTLSLNATTGAYTYTPAHNFKGSDSFSVHVTDQWGTPSNTLTVNVTVK